MQWRFPSPRSSPLLECYLHTTLRVIDAADVPIYLFTSSDGGEGWMHNWTTGVAVPIPAATASFVTVLQAEIAKYIGIYSSRCRLAVLEWISGAASVD